MKTTREVRCPSCGSRLIAHVQGYQVMSLVSEWVVDDNEYGELVPKSFVDLGVPDFEADFGDSCFCCMTCNAEFACADELRVTLDIRVPTFEIADALSIREAARSALCAWRTRDFRVHELMDQMAKAIGDLGDDEKPLTGFEWPDAKLQSFDVTYSDPETPDLFEVFCCRAESEEHAREQALNAYPNAVVRFVTPVRESCIDLRSSR